MFRLIAGLPTVDESTAVSERFLIHLSSIDPNWSNFYKYEFAVQDFAAFVLR